MINTFIEINRREKRKAELYHEIKTLDYEIAYIKRHNDIPPVVVA